MYGANHASLSEFAVMKGCGTQKQYQSSQIKNVYERSDDFSLCYPSDDIFSERLKGTKHMLFKQVP